MKLVAVTQRVTVEPRYHERRDSLDQAWSRFLAEVDLLPIPIPNCARVAKALADAVPIEGLLLTGGEDLAVYGGSTPERDDTELALLDVAMQRGLPVMGVCRGMQLIQHRFAIKLYPVDGHVTPRQRILIEGRPAEVNSYHRLATDQTVPALTPWARSEDGVIEAVRHVDMPLAGIMWHPERMSPFAERDKALFRQFFGRNVECAR